MAKHKGRESSPDKLTMRMKRNVRKMKFIAFINALLTLAYCMTNCFRKPSTQSLFFVLCRFSEKKKNISTTLELKIFRCLSNLMLPGLQLLSWWSEANPNSSDNPGRKIFRGLIRLTKAFVCKQIIILQMHMKTATEVMISRNGTKLWSV